MTTELIPLEIAYALPTQQSLLRVDVPAGSTVREALDLSDITKAHPEIDLDSAKVGIFGNATTQDAVPQAGDRIEIYRPLIADPKTARRKRAADAKKSKPAT